MGKNRHDNAERLKELFSKEFNPSEVDYDTLLEFSVRQEHIEFLKLYGRYLSRNYGTIKERLKEGVFDLLMLVSSKLHQR